MRTTFDLSPFTRSTVGFDRMLRLLDNVASPGDLPSYPPYDIAKSGEDQYRISVAVAGFGEDELEVKTQDNQLTIKSVAGQADADSEVQYLHHGIARRAFELRFSLADHVEVNGAHVDNGLLNVELVREVPEAMKPRTIAIGKTGTAKVLPAKSKAA